MSKFWGVVIIIICINTLLVVTLLNSFESLFGFTLFTLGAESLIGIVLLFFEEYRTEGAAILAGFGLSILIGLSVCGGLIAMN